MNRLYIGGGIAIMILFICIGIGGVLASAAIFAAIKFVALVAVIESVWILRSLAYRLGGLFDIGLLVASFIIMFTSGVTIGMSFTVVGLMWTILYRPYINYKLEKAAMEQHQRKYKLRR